MLNAVTHLPVACVALYATQQSSAGRVFLLFSAVTFFFSFLYHITTHKRLKLLFRRLDVASIFWLIGASVFAFLPLYLGVVILCFCVILSVPVIRAGTSSTFTDVALITLAVACLMLTIVFAPNWPSFVLGVVLYACGLPFYFKQDTKWTHLAWHIFVIAGWAAHLWAHT